MTNHYLRRTADYWRDEAEHQRAMKETYRSQLAATERRFWLGLIAMAASGFLATVLAASR